RLPTTRERCTATLDEMARPWLASKLGNSPHRSDIGSEYIVKMPAFRRSPPVSPSETGWTDPPRYLQSEGIPGRTHPNHVGQDTGRYALAPVTYGTSMDVTGRVNGARRGTA